MSDTSDTARQVPAAGRLTRQQTGRVAGKVALITGAARGQGRAHAVRLAAEGADMILIDVCAELPGVPYTSATTDELAETLAQVEATGRSALSFQVDVRDLDGMRKAVDEGVTELGGLDIVVANAGICIPATWDAVTPEVFGDTMQVNVRGTWNTIMVSAPHLIERGGGSVIVISSAAGVQVQPFLVPYSTSKFAVRGMAKAFAAELGDSGVRVNSIHPCAVDTPMAGPDVMAKLGGALEAQPKLAAMFTNILPYEKAEPEDISNAVLFLASDESRFLTAHEVCPDAGVTEF